MSRSAAAIAAYGCPPPPRIEAAANCAEPANVVTLITMAGSAPIPPDDAARTPNETPNSPTAIASGTRGDCPAMQLEADRAERHPWADPTRSEVVHRRTEQGRSVVRFRAGKWHYGMLILRRPERAVRMPDREREQPVCTVIPGHGGRAASSLP